jgi:hypothetical protein
MASKQRQYEEQLIREGLASEAGEARRLAREMVLEDAADARFERRQRQCEEARKTGMGWWVRGMRRWLICCPREVLALAAKEGGVVTVMKTDGTASRHRLGRRANRAARGWSLCGDETFYFSAGEVRDEAPQPHPPRRSARP